MDAPHNSRPELFVVGHPASHSRRRRTTSALLGATALSAALLLGGCSSDGSEGTSTSTAPTTTELTGQVTATLSTTEVLGADTQFSTFLELVDAADLRPLLDSNDEITVFVPSNAAFEELGDDALAQLRSDPTGALASLVRTQIVPEAIESARLINLNGATLATMDDNVVAVAAGNGDLSVGGADVQKSDIRSKNAVIYLVGSVLQPD